MAKETNVYTCLKFLFVFSHLCGTSTIILDKTGNLKIFKPYFIYQVLLYLVSSYLTLKYCKQYFEVMQLEKVPEIFGHTTYITFYTAVLISQIRNQNEYLVTFKKLQTINDQLKVNILAIKKTCWLLMFVKILIQVWLIFIILSTPNLIIEQLILVVSELCVVSVITQLCAILHTVRLLLEDINAIVKKMSDFRRLVAYLKFHLELLELSKNTNYLYYHFIFRIMNVFSGVVYFMFKISIYEEFGKLNPLELITECLWIFSDIFGLILIIYNYDRIKNEVRNSQSN